MEPDPSSDASVLFGLRVICLYQEHKSQPGIDTFSTCIYGAHGTHAGLLLYLKFGPHTKSMIKKAK